MANQDVHLRVLVVDDDALIRQMLQGLLRGFAEVRLAGSAEEARALLDAEPFDVVLSDYKMPGEDGLSLLEHVARTHPRIRRILCSGSFPASFRPEEQSVCNAMLSKPFVFTELMAAVRGSGSQS